MKKEFSDGQMTLYRADFFEIADTLPVVDAIITDPPYNIADSGKITKVGGKVFSNKEAWGDKFKDKFGDDEYDEFIRRFLEKCKRLVIPGGAIVVFIDRKYAGILARIAEGMGLLYKNIICFNKCNAVPKARCTNYISGVEVAVWLMRPRDKGTKTKPAVFNYRQPVKGVRHADGTLDVVRYHNTMSSNIFFYNVGGKKMVGHPTEKYKAMVAPLIETHTSPGDLILDPFGGSFAIGRYAIDLGRRYIGVELSTEFYDKVIPIYEEIYGDKKEPQETEADETKDSNGKDSEVAA